MYHDSVREYAASGGNPMMVFRVLPWPRCGERLTKITSFTQILLVTSRVAQATIVTPMFVGRGDERHPDSPA